MKSSRMAVTYICFIRVDRNFFILTWLPKSPRKSPEIMESYFWDLIFFWLPLCRFKDCRLLFICLLNQKVSFKLFINKFIKKANNVSTEIGTTWTVELQLYGLLYMHAHESCNTWRQSIHVGSTHRTEFSSSRSSVLLKDIGQNQP